MTIDGGALEGLVVGRAVDAPRDPDGHVDIERLRRALVRTGPVDVLASAPGTGWTYLMPTLRVPDLVRVIDDGTCTVVHHADGRTEDLGPDPFAALDAVLGPLGLAPSATVADPPTGAPPVAGGLLVALGYDLARRLHDLPVRARQDRTVPHLWGRMVGALVAVPPSHDRVITVVAPRLLGDATAATETLAGLEAAVRSALASPPTAAVPPALPRMVRTSLARDAHVAAIDAVLRRIAAGDVYQVNLSQRLTAAWDEDLAVLWRRLGDASPASHAALLPAIGLVSVSPESFLAVDGRRVSTRPIKGTRPRASDAALDAALADDLATSAKDRAENVMVVDLERNDLGRVCVPGSVRVEALTRVERHPTVWHLVSTVTGDLRPDIGHGTLLAATFPSGSVTGAPKLAAMRLIEELEPVRRGWYCGAVGLLGAGVARLSVAIRTATLHSDGTVDYAAGGGIVADSDPEAEVAESLDKAAAFLAAIAATRVDQGPPANGPAGVPAATVPAGAGPASAVPW